MDIQQPGETSLVTVAINLGMEYSCYAFPIHEDASLSLFDRHGYLPSSKIPTTILFDSNKKFHSFGYEAKDHYIELQEEEEENEWYYFDRFPSIFYPNLGGSWNGKLKDIRGRELPAVDVFAEAINYLKSHFIRYLQRKGVDILELMVDWMLVVPDLCNDLAKKILRDAAVEVGIVNHLTEPFLKGAAIQDNLIVESETAYICCRNEVAANTESRVNKPGNKIIVNAGYGTVDVSVYEMHIDHRTRMLECRGQDTGLRQVHKAFETLLKAIVGDSLMSFQQSCPRDKEKLYDDLNGKFNITDFSRKVTVPVPASLREIFEEESGKDIHEVIKKSKFAGKLQWIFGRLRMDFDILKGLLQDAVDGTINLIESLINKHHPVDTIMMVGYFSNVPFLQDRVHEAFPSVECIIPPNPEFAAVTGAVKIGLYSTYSTIHLIAKYTYGFATHRRFNPDMHPAGKKILIGGRAYCKDIFEKFLEIREIIHPGIPQCDKIYKPLQADQRSLELPLFASSEKDPQFVTDEGCFSIGKVEVILPETQCDKEMLVNVKIYYGDAEMTAEAQDVRGSIKYHASVSIDDSKL